MLMFCAVSMSQTTRERIQLDAGWRFHLGHGADMAKDFGFGGGQTFAKAGSGPGPIRPNFNDSAWREVDLPHDWVVEEDFVHDDDGLYVQHGSKPTGRKFPEFSVGWYRRTFDIALADKGRRISAEFDGVFRDSLVWLNGHLLGREPSGYSSFAYDLTDFINYGGKNVLTVRADASQYEGWFYEGAGIYRHVWLVKTSPLHVARHGTFVTCKVDGDEAEIEMVNGQTMFTNGATLTPANANSESDAPLFATDARSHVAAEDELMVENVVADPALVGKKVLVVDDDIRNVFAMTSVLEEAGMRVVSAESGQAAIDTLEESPDMDMVLMDIMMPGMDGYETIHAIRSFANFRPLPIIAVTAKAMPGDREKCLEAGASDYLSKPVAPGQLLASLAKWVNR